MLIHSFTLPLCRRASVFVLEKKGTTGTNSSDSWDKQIQIKISVCTLHYDGN